MLIHRLPFALHILIELPASFGFFLRPSATLRTPQPIAHGIIRQYALLLTASNLIATVFLFQPSATTASRQVAGALALYHAGPLVRAIGRIRAGEASANGFQERLISPWIHGVFHGACLAALLGESWMLL